MDINSIDVNILVFSEYVEKVPGLYGVRVVVYYHAANSAIHGDPVNLGNIFKNLLNLATSMGSLLQGRDFNTQPSRNAVE